MRRIIIVLITVFLTTGMVLAGSVKLEFRGGYFNSADSAIIDIYGRGISFGGEITTSIWKGLEVWAGGSFFQRTGGMTYTPFPGLPTQVGIGGQQTGKTTTVTPEEEAARLPRKGQTTTSKRQVETDYIYLGEPPFKGVGIFDYSPDVTPPGEGFISPFEMLVKVYDRNTGKSYNVPVSSIVDGNCGRGT